MAGGGEGGSVWRCTPAGGKVERVATGFWNCHDLTFDAFGRLFAVDNDPDDIGPSRLLDIIDGGDYGWKFKNGRRGVHPFTAWNGELPGTLPMVAGTGEAPSGILAYESDGLPPDYRGQLLVTSWGDHSIHRYELKEKGASFTSTPADIVRGGEDFRPVGLAQAPDGSVFVTDWVDKSYTLHGKGKLWRIRAANPPREPGGSAAGPRFQVDDVAKLPIGEQAKLLGHVRREVRVSAGAALAGSVAGVSQLVTTLKGGTDDRARLQALWALAGLEQVSWIEEAKRLITTSPWTDSLLAESIRLGLGRKWKHAHEAFPWAKGENSPSCLRAAMLVGGRGINQAEGIVLMPHEHPDPFLQSAAVTNMARSQDIRPGEIIDGREPLSSLVVLFARRSGDPDAIPSIPHLLRQQHAATRQAVLQWIGEDRLTQFAPNLPDALRAGEVTRDLLEAYLACQEKLTARPPEPGKPPAERSGQQFAAEFLFDERHDLKLRKIALELIDPADPKLPAGKLVALIEPMGLEAVKAVAWRDDAESQAALRRIAADGNQPADARREAVVGLSRSALASADTKRVLTDLLFAGPPAVRLDALRSLRGALGPDDAKRLVAELRAEPREGTAARGDKDEREWAEQILLAFKPNPDALGKSDRQRLAALVPPRPTDTAGWQAAAKDGGDVENGRRVFASATSGRCYVCHQADNRGGQVGPDLSGLGRAMDRAKIIESILEPSKEVAPLFVSTVVELKNGDTISGVGLPEAGSNWVSIGDASGKRHRINADDIVSRRPEKLSVMPDGLADTMTVAEFQDLVAYLKGLK